MVHVKTAEETISGQGVMVYLMEELTDARLRCEQLKHHVAEAAKMVSASPHKDHFWEVAGHLMHGIPETLFKLDKALSATALAAGKLDHEGLKQNLRPEKADELERVLEDARIHYVKRRSGDGTMIRPKQAAEALRRMADDIDTSGGFPLGPMVQLLAALEGKEAVGPASKLASVPVHGLVVPATYLRSMADEFTPGPDRQPSRDRLAKTLRRLVAGVMSADMLALLQSAGSREDVEQGFKKENPALTDAQLKEIGDQWEKNKDVVKDKTASFSKIVDSLDDVYEKAFDRVFMTDEERTDPPLRMQRNVIKQLDNLVNDETGVGTDRIIAALASTLETFLTQLGEWHAYVKTPESQRKQAMTLEDVQALKTRILSERQASKTAAFVEAGDMSPALMAFATAFETARAAWKAAQRGNERLTAMQGLGTIVNMVSALSAIAPESAGDLERISAMAMRMLPHLKSEAAKGDMLMAGDKTARFDPISDFTSGLGNLSAKLRDAESEIEDASGHMWKSWKVIAEYQGGGTQQAMKQLGPGVLDVVGDIHKQRDLIHKIRNFALIGAPSVTAAEADKDARHTKGEPLTMEQVTEGMTEEQKAEWKAQNEANRDKFKSASDQTAEWKADL